MNKKDAMKWVEALRSGEHKQGTGALKQCGFYCCLGVLNEIMPDKYEGEDEYSLKSTEFFNSELGDIESLDISLACLNDGIILHEGDEYIKLNFDEIADIIQINYEEL